MDWQIIREDKIPLYQVIMKYIMQQIQSGQLLPGEKLPSERRLAKDALSDASFPDKIKGLRQQIRDRHAYFFDKIGDSLSSRRPLGGFYVWVRLSPEKNLTKQLDQLMSAGILCLPSFIFGDKTPAIRLNIARLTFSEIDDLAETLGQIIV